MLYFFKTNLQMNYLKSLASSFLLLFAVLPAFSSSSMSFCGYDSFRVDYYPMVDRTILGSPELYPYTRCPHIFCNAFLGGENNNANLADWQVYLGDDFTTEEVNTLIYKKDEAWYINLLNRKNTTALARKLATEKGNAFARYMILAKQTEKISSNTSLGSFYSWYQGEDDNDKTDKKPELLTQSLSLIEKETNSFLRQRYAFQLIRLANYLEQPAQAITFFDNYLKDTEKSYIYYRALEQLGGVYYQLKEDEKAAEIFIEVFAELPDRREKSATSLRILNWKKIRFAEFYDKNAPYADMKSFFKVFHAKAPALPEMMKIAVTKPNSKFLRLLALRELDQIQEELFAEYSPFYKRSTVCKGKGQQIVNLRILAETQLESKELIDKDFWRIMLGMSYFGAKNHTEAKKHFQQVQSNSRYNAQAERLLFAVDVDALTYINRTEINRLYEQLKQTQNLNIYEPAVALFFNKTAELYENEGNTIASNIAYYSFYGSYNGDMDNFLWKDVKKNLGSYWLTSHKHKFNEKEAISAYKALLATENKTSFEKFLLSLFKVSPTDYLHELEGTRFLIDGELEKAIVSFKKIKKPSDFYSEAYRAELFSAAINEYFDTDFYKQSDKFYENYSELFTNNLSKNTSTNREYYSDNKLKLSRVLLKLQQLGEANPANAADYYYMLGNAYYNMSEVGWFSNTFNYVGNDSRNWFKDYSNYVDEQIKANLTPALIQANKFYKKALALSGSKEVKARTVYMLAKTNYNISHIRIPNTYGYRIETSGAHSDYFSLLSTTYADTNFQKEVIKECSWYRVYLGL